MTSNKPAHAIRGPIPLYRDALRTVPSFILLILLSSCARPPFSGESSSTVPMFTSQDGLLRYAVPSGWFDATTNAKGPRSAIWLIRNDYCASIVVKAVEIDEETRREVTRAGLFRVGHLSMQLNTNVRSAVVVQAPRVDRSSGREYCVYEIEEPATCDRIWVTLFDTGRGVYEVTALHAGGDRKDTSEEVFAVQSLFLARLQW